MNKMAGEMLIPEIKKDIVDRLSKPPKALRVILFGSYAYGTPHEDSDIDLLGAGSVEWNTLTCM